MSRFQHPRTIGRSVTVEGLGLHGNRPCRVTVNPVEEAGGLRFLHVPSGVCIPARAEYTGNLDLATTLVKDGVRLQTIEHLLSALAGLGIDHARIDVDGEELPILDGSSSQWTRQFLEAGTRDLPGARRWIRVLRPVEARRGDRFVRVSPYEGLRLRYTIEFPGSPIGRQSREMSLTPEKYRKELAQARTFCLQRDIELMQSRGLALGGSLENAVVYGDKGPLNESLRFEDEAVRHKMLDLVGDLALLGAPVQGYVEAFAAGHALHVALVSQLLAEPDAWTWAEGGEVALRSLFPHGVAPELAPA